jgi:hypothetical protein
MQCNNTPKTAVRGRVKQRLVDLLAENKVTGPMRVEIFLL